MAAARTYDELKDAITARYPRLSPQLQRIARFALERPNELALGTVAAMAGAADVQPSALIRFANALDFDGFTEMQQLFRARLVERSGSYRERIGRMQRATQRPAAGARCRRAAPVRRRCGRRARPPRRQRARRRPGRRRAPHLRRARVHVLAQRRAFPVACYLAYALGQLELQTHLLDGVGGMLGESLRGIAPRDALLVASFRNYSPEVIEAPRACPARGVPVVAITDTALSPLKAPAPCASSSARGRTRPFRSLVAPMCLAQALVVSVGHRLTAPKAAAAKSVGNGRRRSAGKGGRA